MLSLPYLLNRLIGPFFTGVFAAAAASADGPVSTAILVAVATGFAFLSLPATERLITRALSELDELTAWPAEESRRGGRL